MTDREPVGPELRVRTIPDPVDPEVSWVSAALLFEDGDLVEIARVRRDLLLAGDEAGGDPLFHGWLDAVGAIFRRRLERLTGVELTLKRVGARRRRRPAEPGDSSEPATG